MEASLLFSAKLAGRNSLFAGKTSLFAGRGGSIYNTDGAASAYFADNGYLNPYFADNAKQNPYQSSGGLYNILTQLRIVTFGQSNIDYMTKRGQPRAVLDFVARLKYGMDYINPNVFQQWSGTPSITSDATSRLGNDYSIRYVNAAQGGSALVDVLGTNEVNPATSSTPGEPNNWFNTVDNTAITGNPLDVADSYGIRGRNFLAYIGTYGCDLVMGSHGGTDAVAIGSNTSNRALYKSKMVQLINDSRTASGNPNMPWCLSHHARHNKAADPGYQAIREIQYELSQEMAFVYLSAEEYYDRLAYANQATASFTSGSNTINTTNTAIFGVGDGIGGNSKIPDNTYITAISAGVSVTINKLTTGAATNEVVWGIDDVHMYPGNTQPLDYAGNTSHNLNDGFYAHYGRFVKNITNVFKKINLTQKRYGPAVVDFAATAGSSTIDATISYANSDDGNNLTTLNGAISVASAPQFRIENNGSPMTITGITLVNAGLLRFTTSSPVSAGTLNFYAAYGAMNKTDYKDFITDNGVPTRALLSTSPNMNPAMSKTIAAVTVPGAIDSIFPTSAVMQVESTMTASYSGTGQTWTNIIAAPADGSLQSVYDMRLGASSGVEASDPTFTGTAGTAAAYFLDNGATFFESIAVNTAFINAMHKTTGGVDWTNIEVYSPGTTTSGVLFSTQASSTTPGIVITSATSIGLNQRGDTANYGNNFGTVTAGTDYCLITTYQASTGTLNRYLNARTPNSTIAAFNATSTDASVNQHMDSRSDGNGFMPSGTKRRSRVILNKFINNTEAGQAYDYFNALHAKTYA